MNSNIIMTRRNLKIAVAALALVASATSFAAPFTFDTTVTGANLAGISVTANFVGGGSETLLWAVISYDPSVAESDIPGQEVNSGGVIGSSWSLTQQGYTLGDVDGSTVYGLWSFADDSVGIESLVVDATGTNVVFDTEFLADLGDDLNGSSQGRPFISPYDGVSYAYSNLLIDELFKTLTLTMSSPGTDFVFLADADVTVPEPASMMLLGAGLLGLAGLRRRNTWEV